MGFATCTLFCVMLVESFRFAARVEPRLERLGENGAL